MGGAASRDAGHKKDDGYAPPAERARARQHPAPAAVLTDPDVAAFDPTADKHDYLLVFATESARSAATLSWAEVGEIWFQAIPGDEEKKTRGVELLKRDWVQRFGDDEVCGRGDVLGLCREHVVDLLARRSGLQLKLSLPSDGQARVYCQLRAPVSLLERKADALDYKFKFKGAIDPGPAFWRKTSGMDRTTGRPLYDEIVEDARILERDQAQETLQQLYAQGRCGPSDMAVFAEAEPTPRHWSRRVHALERISDRVPVHNPYAAHAPYDAAPRERHLYEEYPSVRGRTLFLPKDRLYLTKRIVDEVFDFAVLRERGLIEAFVALHDANYGEMPTTDWLQKRWVFFWRAEASRAGAPLLSHPYMLKGKNCPCYVRPWAQPLAEIRAYFGEKVALYFAWLAFYGYSLIYPALFCFAVYVYDSVKSINDEDEGVHVEQFLVAGFLVAWSAYYKECWDIESQYCAVRWGTLRFEEEEQDRPQFVGDATEPRRVSPITNQSETYYPESKRSRTRLVSFAFVLLAIATLVVLITLIFWAQYFFTYTLGGVFWTGMGSCMSGVQALLIQVASVGYGIVAVKLNDAENYRTQTTYENNLIIKKFAFEVFNNYTALIITAFFKGPYFKCDGGFSSDTGDCLADLEELLVIIFLTRYALALVGAFARPINEFVAYLTPRCLVVDEEIENDEEHGEANEEGPPAEAPRFEAELKLEEYEGMFDDYAEIVLQMGLVTMFTLGLYLTPLLGAGEVLLQMRVDAYKLTALAQRPDPTPAESVGSWGVLMEGMGLLAVYANAGIIVATTKSFHAYSSLQRLIIFFVVEQALLALKLAVHAAIDDEPTKLGELKKRNAHVVARHKNAVFDDDLDGKSGDAIAVDADALSVAALRAMRVARPEARRLEYLRRKLLGCDKDLRDLRQQYRDATASEVYREDLGVSYSRERPDLALGMVSLQVSDVVGLGSPGDPVDAHAMRLVVHVRGDGNSEAGPAPQVSRPAHPPRVEEGESDATVGARLVFDQHFSVAPIKTTQAELRIEVVDDAKKLRRGFVQLPLAALADQKQQALDLELARPGGAGGRPAFLRATAQFQYSKVVPIKREIVAKLEEQRRLHRDVTNLQIGRDVEYEDDWDFPDKAGAEDAKEEAAGA